MLDVLRLSRGMTYKAAAAGLNLGGGKAVIIGDPKQDKTEALFRAFGRFVESLNGRYITAEDVGTSIEDMDVIFMETRYVTGVSPDRTAAAAIPRRSPPSAPCRAIKAAVQHLGAPTRQGAARSPCRALGHVGYHLVAVPRDAGAKVFGRRHRPGDDRAGARGARRRGRPHRTRSTSRVRRLRALRAGRHDQRPDHPRSSAAEIVAGAANNQLADDATATSCTSGGSSTPRTTPSTPAA